MEHFYQIGYAIAVCIFLAEMFISFFHYLTYNHNYNLIGMSFHPFSMSLSRYSKRSFFRNATSLLWRLVFCIIISLSSWLYVVYKALAYVIELTNKPEFIKEFHFKIRHSNLGQRQSVALMLSLDNKTVTSEMIDEKIISIKEDLKYENRR